MNKKLNELKNELLAVDKKFEEVHEKLELAQIEEQQVMLEGIEKNRALTNYICSELERNEFKTILSQAASYVAVEQERVIDYHDKILMRVASVVKQKYLSNEIDNPFDAASIKNACTFVLLNTIDCFNL